MTREKGRERLDTDTRSLYGHRLSLSLSLYLSLSVTVCLSSQIHRFSYAGYAHGYTCLTTTRMEVINALASLLVRFCTMHRYISATRLRCVSALMIFYDFPCRVHCGTEFWALDMVERQELPNDVPCGANCLGSGLGHACVKSSFHALCTCFLGLFTKHCWMLSVLCNAMRKEEVIHDGAPAG